MSDEKISQMASAGALMGSDLLPLVRLGSPNLNLATTPNAIAAFSGGGTGGGFAPDPFTTGLSHTVDITAKQTITACTSATAGAKSISLPGAVGLDAGTLWVLKLTLSDSTVYTITPASGTIEGAGIYVVADVNAPAIWFVSDGVSNWMLV